MDHQAALDPVTADYLDQLRDMIVVLAAVEVDRTTITLETAFAADLMFDSIGLVSLMALSEERFGVDVEGFAKQIANVRTVGNAIALIRTLEPAKNLAE